MIRLAAITFPAHRSMPGIANAQQWKQQDRGRRSRFNPIGTKRARWLPRGFHRNCPQVLSDKKICRLFVGRAGLQSLKT